jgi:hypothetical protein
MRDLIGPKKSWLLSVDSSVKARAQADAALAGMTMSAYITRLITHARVPEPSLGIQLAPIVSLGNRIVARLDSGALSDSDRTELASLRRAIADVITAVSVSNERDE